MSRHAKRRDANEDVIVASLMAVGAFVQRLDATGCPDLLVGFRGRTFLVEVKNPDGKQGATKGGARRPGRGCISPHQVAWFAAWTGEPVVEVINVDEALRAIGART